MPAPAADALPAYPTLLSPVRLGPLHLRNRLVMGSMHTRLPFGEGNPARLAAFYAERARGGVAMIITGGVAPNAAGRMEDGAAVLDSEDALAEHRQIVAAVHDADAAIVMQILHAGRYAKHAEAVSPSNISAPINPVKPRRLSGDEIENTINDYAKCAALAQAAGYDGVDVMGSEGYLINEFTARRTNDRSDAWGGSAANRTRLPVQIIRRMRARVGAAFAILYRISALDLVEDGAIRILQFDCTMMGGFTTGRKLAALCELNQVQVAPHHDCFIHAHIVAGSPAGCIVESFTDPERDPLQAELFEDPPKITNGMMKLKEQPGLGLTLSPAALKKFGEQIL